ncbi:G protein-regulated inducer of neurite outgrowth 2 [Electrophorus electricus]|uniref:G protein-regulated inducer of neurite outgrowth C-terminal domain-containing protein n=1 Tax=Electrophorus electricus TaxID=8005 RepID=A0A4W4ECN6_ELEEL|nr:G protein-regulated inducer of neurite outgrowth 2 [Electrophorus electricus]
MTETGRPLLGQFPPGGAIPCDAAFPNVSVLPVSTSSAELTKASLQPVELQKHSSEAPCSENVLEDSNHTKPNATVAVRSAASPHSIADVHVADRALALREDRDSGTHQKEQSLGANVSCQHRDLGEQSLAPAKLPAQRSLSDSLHTQKGGPALELPCEPSGMSPETSSRPLAGTQAMQPPGGSTTTAFCREGDACSGRPVQQDCPPSASSGSLAAGERSGATKHSRLEEAICWNSCPHVAIEGTFAAYCHPQPISVSPHGAGHSTGQGGGSAMLALPRLIPSIGETGLDGKPVPFCCSLDCDRLGPLRRFGSQQRAEDEGRPPRDVATMTSPVELRDAGVQVGQEHPEGQAQHVFPEVRLSREGPAARRKSPVREVKWDTEGMTWEVYGASVDPEELGLAIQKHLELQIKETAGRAVKLSRQSTVTSHASAGKGQRRRRSLMAALRPPGCCTRTTTAAD